MATVNMDWFLGLFHPRKRETHAFANAKEAYDFARRVHRETGGPTPELRQLYSEYREYKMKKGGNASAAVEQRRHRA
jgi:hypothetical protein